MHTSRLTSTFLAASRREPVARLVDTTAGSSWGVMPTATARENSTASMTGRPKRDVDHEDRDAEHPADLGQQPREAGETELELGLGVAFPEPDRDPPELGGRPGRHHHGVGGALVHDGSHEQARRQLGERGAARHRLGRLLRRDRFAGEDRLVAFEVARGQEPDIRRDDRPDPEVHDVARHQVRDLDAHRLAVARRGDLVADLGVHRLRGASPLGTR